MRSPIAALATALLLAGNAEAQPQCEGLASAAARLRCYNAAAEAVARSKPKTGPGTAAAPGSCTRTAPCTGPRGGVYYFTAGGNKRYLPH